jgi:hypothetical protein
MNIHTAIAATRIYDDVIKHGLTMCKVLKQAWRKTCADFKLEKLPVAVMSANAIS